MSPVATVYDAMGERHPARVADARFPIGTVYTTTRGRETRTHTVTDILRTFNAAGELVRVRYVATHQFAGQTVEDCDVCDTTIAKGIRP